VLGALRVLALDVLFCAGVAAVLTLLFLADGSPTLAQWLGGFLFNFVIATAIGLSLSNLYRFAHPWFLGHFPGRLGQISSHVLILAIGVGGGVEVALRLIDLFHGPDIGAMRWDVFRVALVVSAIIAANAVAFEKLKGRARSVELKAQRAQQEALRARLEALQARTNPHFLFNSLNTVAGLIEEDPKAAERVLEKLSSLFRYALDGSNTDWVRLERELEVVSSYLEVERLRLGDRLRAELDLGPGVEELLVPPLVLQPLVENAVVHAVAPRSEGGWLRVSAHRNGSRLLLEVEDDGPGFGASDHRGSGTALDDLRRRLDMVYGGEASLSNEPAERGCLVKLALPVGPSSAGEAE
jgi:two-component system sensor histidine kinase AlgZ